MKIGIDVTPMFRQRGGVGWYTYHLITFLAHIDKKNTYVLYCEPSSRVSDDFSITQPNFSIVKVSKWNMRSQARYDHIELFHGTNYKLPAYGKCGSVVTVHDLALERFPHHSRKFFGQRWASWKSQKTFTRADRIIAVSQHTAQDLHAYYKIPSEKIDVVYHGSSFGSSHAHNVTGTLSNLSHVYGLGESAYILHVGGGEPRKNISTLLEAYAMLGDLRSHYKLLLVGAMGPWKEQIMRQVKQLQLQDSVIAADYVTYEELQVLYQNAALFVYPSLYEGFGIPPLEAMSSGVPVITSNTSSLPEIVGDAAVMIDPMCPQDFMTSIAIALTNVEFRKELIKKGLARAKKFSWEQAARDTLAIYNDVVKEANDRSLIH